MKKIDIEMIKKHGQIKELKSEIDSNIFSITNRTFSSYVSNNRYKGLKKRLNSVKDNIEKIEKLLSALNELQPGND